MADRDKPSIIKVDLGMIYLCHRELSDHKDIVELFDKFGYDVANSQHWIWLLSIFAKKELGPRRGRGRGRQTKWTKKSRRRLFVDLWLLQKIGQIDSFPKNHGECADLLKKHCKQDPFYTHTSEEEIRKNYGKCIRELKEDYLLPHSLERTETEFEDEVQKILEMMDKLACD